MGSFQRRHTAHAFAHLFTFCLTVLVICLTASSTALGQAPAKVQTADGFEPPRAVIANSSTANESWVAAYVDPVQGASSTDLVRRALTLNTEIAAVRLDINRARARLRQAGLRPNPTLDFEQQRGVFDSPGESTTSIGVAVPLELGGKRRGRLDLARAELAAAEAEVADRERRLTAEVRAGYAEAMAALRELEITGQLNNFDVQTAEVVEVRVKEGDAAPLELNMLRVEVERLRARRALIEGRLEAALLRLKNLTGTPANERLTLREELATPLLPDPPASLEAAVEIALRTRPDLRLARLNEEVAQAGLRLARAQSFPEVTAFSRYSRSQSSFDETPIGMLTDRDKLFAFGVSISIPVFNRNQGAKAEAEAAISQSQQRRQFIEAVVRADVTSAYVRHEAATRSLRTFEEGVIARSSENINAIRAAYQIGAFRVTDLINEQRRLVDAQREYTEALAERFRALADLQAALGTTIQQ